MVTWGRPSAEFSFDTIVSDTHDRLMESQLAKVFERILRLDQRARRHVEPIHQSGQEEAQRRAAAQDRQSLPLDLVERPNLGVGLQQRAPFSDIVGEVLLEAPGVETDRNVVGEGIGAGEIKVDQARQLVAKKEHVVWKEIGMDD